MSFISVTNTNNIYAYNFIHHHRNGCLGIAWENKSGDDYNYLYGNVFWNNAAPGSNGGIQSDGNVPGGFGRFFVYNNTFVNSSAFHFQNCAGPSGEHSPQQPVLRRMEREITSSPTTITTLRTRRAVGWCRGKEIRSPNGSNPFNSSGSGIEALLGLWASQVRRIRETKGKPLTSEDDGQTLAPWTRTGTKTRTEIFSGRMAPGYRGVRICEPSPCPRLYHPADTNSQFSDNDR